MWILYDVKIFTGSEKNGQETEYIRGAAQVERL